MLAVHARREQQVARQHVSAALIALAWRHELWRHDSQPRRTVGTRCFRVHR